MKYQSFHSKYVHRVNWRFYFLGNTDQGLINLPSDRKHKPNLGFVLPGVCVCIYLPKLDGGRGAEKKGDSTNTIEKTYNIFLVLSVTFYIYK